jgi:hypothetical protein
VPLVHEDVLVPEAPVFIGGFSDVLAHAEDAMPQIGKGRRLSGKGEEGPGASEEGENAGEESRNSVSAEGDGKTEKKGDHGDEGEDAREVQREGEGHAQIFQVPCEKLEKKVIAHGPVGEIDVLGGEIRSQ